MEETAKVMPLNTDDLTYVVEKLGAAVYELQGAGDIRARLFSAWMRGLARILPDALPDALRGEYEEIMEALSRLPPEVGEARGGSWQHSLP